MEIKWLGTAGFEVKTGNQVFLIDPYLSRNQNAFPRQDIMPCDIQTASQIFISHSHFDHILDIPQIARQTNADIYCSKVAANMLIRHQVDKHRINPVIADKKKFDFKRYSARAFFSDHIQFDKKLVFSTLLRTHVQLFKYLPLFWRFPCGRVLSWRFMIEDKIIQFFGSARSSLKTLKKIGNTPIDILMFPLQGHSNICKIGLNHVRYLKPKLVIPHHHDNFFPPISKTIDISPFVDQIKKKCKDTRIIVPQINECLTF
ncbi:MBL fold metallo-hydrolase [Desulfobacula phenolica]|uniref:L-ascorbate metabolism protein UlaG, beta-lactamase superfamily n=1 Tax=Desulfobacula phenolica TaxID=90732 RepID=A0A1H2JLK4_9BACT|nr:MBL fold metallo-hydrolase [Desulfobacula phenolica]SDU57232.1 L-ascorbate metabolism protein UlaG, beta-lactamase superfamily [Desulfobacula phenolica]